VYKLLFDNNISHRIVNKIVDIFPNSTHVMLEKLDEEIDIKIWQFAYQNNYTIVTKDSDFNYLAIHKNSPPKIIWIKQGNCKVSQIEKILKDESKNIKSFIDDANNSILELRRT
jgi:predicted nuclease of predicted toxin-antitoxin system